MIDFRMPSLGADMETGTLRAWRKRVGDPVKRGDIIADVETQKGIIEIEVFDDGVVHELLLKEDEKVPVGTVMARLLAPGGTAPPAGAPAAPTTQAAPAPVAPPPPAPAAAVPAPATRTGIKASPLARRMAAEQGIDLATLTGSGPEGAITKEDVEHAIAARVAPKAASPAAATPGQAMRMAVAAAMSRSNREIPHYFLQTAIDMTAALDWLRGTNAQRPVQERMLPAVLLVKAVALALRTVPDLNAYWTDGPIPQPGVHVGFVVSLRGGGILVPAVHDADQKDLDTLMRDLTDLIIRARQLKLRSSELSDGTFTISSLGEEGVEAVFGKIYPPQVGLAGFGGIVHRPWAVNGAVAVRPMLTATLAADHRATDGATGSRFLQRVNELLQHPETL